MNSLYVARNPRVAARMLGGEMMIMSARDSTLFTLNETASVLWQAADGATPLARSSEDSARNSRSNLATRCAMPRNWRVTLRATGSCGYPMRQSPAETMSGLLEQMGAKALARASRWACSST